MAHDTSSPSSSGPSDGQPRGQRAPGNRDSGGFRIRLSDNEMQAARALQEAFGLRSTVAVLGFSLRTLAQQLEQGSLDALVAQHRAQGDARPRPQSRRDGDGRPAEGRGGEGRGGEGRGGRFVDRGGSRGPRLDPFARPSRPPAPQPEQPADAPGETPELEPETVPEQLSVDAELPAAASEGGRVEPGSEAAPLESPADAPEA